MRILLLALCLLLVAAIIAEWMIWPVQPDLVNQGGLEGNEESATEAEIASEDSFTLPPLNEFNSIIERPLFIEGRRPLSAETSVQEDSTILPRGSLQPPQLDLSAILIVKDEPRALLRNPPKGGATQLKKGDDFQGWKVETITPDRVTLKQGEKSEEFMLRVYKEVPLPRVSKTNEKRRQIKKRATRQLRRPPKARQR